MHIKWQIILGITEENTEFEKVKDINEINGLSKPIARNL